MISAREGKNMFHSVANGLKYEESRGEGHSAAERAHHAGFTSHLAPSLQYNSIQLYLYSVYYNTNCL